jgi:hypothetical protein
MVACQLESIGGNSRFVGNPSFTGLGKSCPSSDKNVQAMRAGYR